MDALVPGTWLVEASAGTGKTYNITTLYLQLIVEQSFTVDQILVVTFTDAATTELRDRIRARLRAAAAVLLHAEDTRELPEDEELAALVDHARTHDGLGAARRRLELAVTCFDEAAISTIHGFCRRMLQQNAFESGADFEAELVSDPGELVDDLVRDFWARRVHAAPPPFLRYLDDVGFGPSSLVRLARKVTSHPRAQVLPAEVPRATQLTFGHWESARSRLKQIWSREEPAIRDSFRWAKLRWPVYNLEAREQAIGALEAFVTGDARPGEMLDPAFELLTPDHMAKWVKAGARVPDHPVHEACASMWAAEQEQTPDLAARLLRMKLDFVAFLRDELPRRKHALGVQTFDDLLAQLDDAMADPARGPRLRDAITSQYSAALIDEFQDTDAVQYAIFRRAFHHEPGAARGFLYLIGDPKQAIYAFRGADVFAYLDARHDAHATSTQKVNWRSDEGLVEAVEHVFARPGLRHPFVLEDITYPKVRAAHEEGRLAGLAGAPLSIRFVPRVDDGPHKNTAKHGQVRKSWALTHLPRMVARDIAHLLNARPRIRVGEDDDPGWREVAPRDVAVLTATNRQARLVQDALRVVGIPSVLRSADSVFETNDALELGLVLRAIGEPGHATALRAALATRLLGIDAHDLVELERDERRWDDHVERFRAWNRQWHRQGFAPMFRALLAELGVGKRLLEHQDGERRVTNLLHLAEILHRASVEQGLGPARLRRWLERQKQGARGDDVARELRLETDADAIEIVTVHRAKGLEYPIVFCPFLWDPQAPRADDTEYLVFHDRLDRSVKIDLGSRNKPKHLAWLAEEHRAENVRKLYVALTRARHRCVLYWGALYQAELSALAWTLHQDAGEHPSPAARLAATSERFTGLDDEALRAELHKLASASAGRIELSTAQAGDAIRWEAKRPPSEPLGIPIAARPTLDTGWRRTSFTGLVHAGSKVRMEVDQGTGHARPEPAGGPPVLLAGFPRGATAGLFFHGVLEDIDFAAPRDAHVVLRHLDEARIEHEWLPLVLDGLDEICSAPLDGTGVRLMDLHHTVREMDFLYPAAGGLEAQLARVNTAALAAVLAEHPGPGLPDGYAERLAALPAPPFQGFVTGSIDLLARVGERWVIADYKSNHLGDTRGCYAPDRLAGAMADHHYPLQYLLYTLALHRYLRWRQAGYDPDRHLGGCWYAFLRGMHPDGGGVFFDRPPTAQVLALDALLERGR